MTLNPRYLAYCRAHGVDSGTMLREERGAGSFHRFMAFIEARWRLYGKIHGRKPPWTDQNHREFDAWLSRIC